MAVIERLAHTVSVLQRGRVIAEGTYAQVSTHPQVLEAYMGSEDAALGEAAHA
ncbi:Branched-chain amino acid ATP-binding cassette transporter [compost metagenome]